MHVPLCDECADALAPLLTIPPGRNESHLLRQVISQLEHCPLCASYAPLVRQEYVRVGAERQFKSGFRSRPWPELDPVPLPPQPTWRRTRTI